MRCLDVGEATGSGAAAGGTGASPSQVTDRTLLRALLTCYPPRLVDEVLATTHRREQRRRRLPARTMVYFTLALWVFRGEDDSYSRVWRRIEDVVTPTLGQSPPGGDPLAAGAVRRNPVPAASSLVRARERLGPEPVRMLFDAAARSVRQQPRATLGGLRVVVIDWSVLGLPHTAANSMYTAPPGVESSPIAFDAAHPRPAPRILWGAAADPDSGGLLSASFGRAADGPAALVPDIASYVGPGDVVLLPTGSGADQVAAELIEIGAHVVWRRSPTTGPVTRPVAAPPRQVRVIATPTPLLGTLLTDLAADGPVSDTHLGKAYRDAWTCARVIGERAGDQGQDIHMRSRDPGGVAQEFWAMVSAYQAFRQPVGTAVSP